MSEETKQTAIFQDPQTQAVLNTPLKKDGGMSAEDESFLDLILKLVNEGRINLYRPSSLFNDAIYQPLSDPQKEKVEIEAMNLLNSIREIKGLCDAGYRETFQVENLVSHLRLSKERLEELGGDLFII